MKKIPYILIFSLFLLLFLIYINGYNSVNTTPLDPEPNSNSKDATENTMPLDPEINPNSENDTLAYTVNKEITPQINNESAKYKNTQLNELNIKTDFSNISYVYFLDNKNIIFSLNNGSNKNSFEENYDLYKYDLENNQLTLICTEYMLYFDCSITVKDSSSFSIIKDGSYLNIENNMVKNKRDVLNDAKLNYPNVSNVFYNENNDKMLILENNPITKNNGVFLSDSDFSFSEKLPFINVYSVQWADKNNVLVAYKDDNGKSYLAKYNLSDKNTFITTLPDENYFIDPVISDNDIIKFFYLEPIIGKPWGFLDVNQGVIDRIYFESSNPTSIVRNGRMAGFSQSISEKGLKNQLFLYDTTSKSIIIRNNSVDFPQTVAVSPDGEKIIFVVGNSAGESIFYVNEKP